MLLNVSANRSESNVLMNSAHRQADTGQKVVVLHWTVRVRDGLQALWHKNTSIHLSCIADEEETRNHIASATYDSAHTRPRVSGVRTDELAHSQQKSFPYKKQSWQPNFPLWTAYRKIRTSRMF
ncbi:hypothetical protein EVAR_57360_1 [Eumeta japonica]|uniref:Uncharacterized protein n=1 Tax=Eumeta variegata TaxID=151549 RepID=A0A4C1ZH41_EUMVA|nr:hypothetical protein EVAR_57360_1 [Eumeta japonica]